MQKSGGIRAGFQGLEGMVVPVKIKALASLRSSDYRWIAGIADKRYAFDYSKSYGQLHQLDSRPMEAKIKHYQEVIRLANTTADLCDQWVQEHQQCADFWRREAQHAALLLSLALVKKWGRENNA